MLMKSQTCVLNSNVSYLSKPQTINILIAQMKQQLKYTDITLSSHAPAEIQLYRFV